MVNYGFSGRQGESGDDLVQRVFDDPFRAQVLEVWDEVSDSGLVDDGFHGHSAGLGK